MIERFKKIFEGLNVAYGQTIKTNEISEKGKHKTKSFTVKKVPTDDLWQAHLDGSDPALGIIPIREDSTCTWGCIDWDTYPLDHKKISLDLKSKQFPLTVFRSKSGGAHLFLFTSEPVSAELMRKKLKSMAADLGLSKAEIFPKQISIKIERGDFGSFLNLPYHNIKNTVRYAHDLNGNPLLELNDFFDHYEKIKLTLKELNQFEIVAKKEDDDFKGMPPCLVTLLGLKVFEGQRNDAMYNVGVYLKKRYPDESTWRNKMDSYNNKYFVPPMGSSELETTKDSVCRKDYRYKCKEQPIEPYCDSKICSTKEFGVGDDTPAVTISSIRKYDSDPPVYFCEIDGSTVEVDSKTLHEPDAFSVACLEQIGTPLMPTSKLMWRKMLIKLLENIELTDDKAPDDLKTGIQLQEALADFINKTPGKEIKDILRGIAYIEDDTNTAYFKFDNFWKYLVRIKWSDKNMNKNKVMRLLQTNLEAKIDYPKINTKTVRCLKVPRLNLDRPEPTERKIGKPAWQKES